MGASKCLENEQETLVSSRRADKCAFSEACSDEVLLNRKGRSGSPLVVDSLDFVDTVSPKQSSDKLSFHEVDKVVEPKQYECLQSNIITMFTIIFAVDIKLLLLLNVFISRVLKAVDEKSTSCRDKRARFHSDAGSSELNSSKVKLPVFCYELSKEKNPQVFQVVDVGEQLEFENIIVDFLENGDVAVTEAILNVVLSGEVDPDISPFSMTLSEHNDKPIDGQVEFEPPILDDVGSVSCQTKLAEAVTGTCLPEVCLGGEAVKFCDSNAIPVVASESIDSIHFPFVADGSTILVRIEGHEFQCLVDTGAAITAVDADVCNEHLCHECPVLNDSKLENITSVDGKRLTVLGKTTIKFVIQAEVFPFETYVIKGLSYNVILGRNFLRKYSSKIDFEKGVMEFVSSENPLPFCDEEAPDFIDSETEPNNLMCSVHADFSFVIPPQSEIIVPAKLSSIPKSAFATGVVTPRSSLPEKYSVFGASELVCVSEDGTVPVRMINPSFQPVKIYRRTRLGDFEEVHSTIDTFELNSIEHSNSSPSPTVVESHRDYSDLPDLSDSVLSDGDKVKFKDLFRKYRDVFAFSDDQLGRTSLVQHTIDTGDAAPIKQRPYRTTPENKQEIDRQVSDMLQRGIIQESVSPWSSPVVLVKKKNGEMRFCIDFRRINKITKKDSFPMPLVADTLDALSGTQFFTTLDLKSGYWQIQLHPTAREKTAFVTHNGLYEFLVMPFGLTNSGASFQRLMGHILRGLEYRFALIYIDDIIIFSKSVEEHLAYLEEVFRRLRDANVKLNPKKWSFVKQKVEYLGHVVTPDGVIPNPEKVRVVRDFPVPKNLKELRAFMGLANYYRRFVKGFAHIANPLNALTKKGVKFVWTQSCADAFDKLKRALISAPILAYPDFKKEFLLFVDASSTGIGFTLAQNQNGKEVVIAYNGRGLNNAEQNYSTTEREALALVEGIKKFQPYLFGRRFTVVTDHSSLRWLMNVKDATGRLARWSLLLQQYDFEIVHRPGKEHSNADSLSRRPYEVDSCLNSLQKEDHQLARTKEFQRRDPELSEIIDFLENDVVPFDDKSARKLFLTSDSFYIGQDGLLLSFRSR